MNKIIELLKKIGFLHVGGGTYKGKNVGGDYATADMQTNKKKEQGSGKKAA